MIDYPSYGTSKGTPTEESIYQMSINVYDEISLLYGNEEDYLIVMGYSLGTGVATYVAQNRDTEKLILLAPNSYMVDVLHSKCPIFYGPLEKLLVNEYDSYSRFSEIEEEILIFASRDDEIINFSLTMKLVEDKAEYDYLYINDILHNDILHDTDVLLKVGEFIDDNEE